MKSAIHRPHHQPASERGSAVLMLLVLLSMMLFFVADNARTTYRLNQELRLLEKRQVERRSAQRARPAAAGVTITNQTAPP
jgi:hypothetical protein